MTRCTHPTHALVVVFSGRSSQSVLEKIESYLERSGALSRRRWLCKGKAIEFLLAIPSNSVGEVDSKVDSLIAGSKADHALVALETREKKVLVADLESTIIENEMLEELSAEVGLGDQMARITRAAMNGEIDFRRSLSERISLLEGMSTQEIEVARARIRVSAGAKTLVATMRGRGAVTALVTSGFSCFADEIGRELGFDLVYSNHLEIERGKITGRLVGRIVDGEEKRRILHGILERHDSSLDFSAAVGDGANDLPMLQAASLGVAYHAKPAVAAAARYLISYTNLETLLYFQGIDSDSFRC